MMDDFLQKCLEEATRAAAEAKEMAILEAFAAGLHMDDIAGIQESISVDGNKVKIHCKVVTVHDLYKRGE